MSWAQRLKRVLNIAIETCPACGGHARIIACMEDPVVIRQILDTEDKDRYQRVQRIAASRAPPMNLFT